MTLRPPRSTPTDTPFPSTTLFRSYRNNVNSSVGYWEPSTAISGHAILVGSSGVGKTHRLRYLIRSLITNTRNINIHILDVHGDIAAAARNRVVFSEITEYGLTTLEVTTDQEFGGVRRRIHSYTGRASSRKRRYQYGEIWVVAVA